MAAYLIYTQLEVLDPDLMAQYRAGVGETVAKYGGENVANAEFEIKEGTWDGARTVVTRYPDMATLKVWYDSPEYKPLLEMRLKGARGNMIFIEGA